MNKIITLSIIFLAACSPNKKTNQSKSWVLNQESSSLAIVTTKNNKVSEVSEFTKFKGSINQANYLSIELDMTSLETNIPIRNERIGKHLFETDLYPTAEIHTQLKPEDLTPGAHTITFDVDLHGVSGILNAEFMVFEQYEKKIITLHTPLIVNADMFGMELGITTLKNIAKLQNIDFTVPIHIVLTFE
jgi:polyisoprenoid-binding protein YceI